MPKISVEVPAELLADLDEHVGPGAKFVNRSEAVRASIRKTLDQLDEIDARHGRLSDAGAEEETGTGTGTETGTGTGTETADADGPTGDGGPAGE